MDFTFNKDLITGYHGATQIARVLQVTINCPKYETISYLYD